MVGIDPLCSAPSCGRGGIGNVTRRNRYLVCRNIHQRKDGGIPTPSCYHQHDNGFTTQPSLRSHCASGSRVSSLRILPQQESGSIACRPHTYTRATSCFLPPRCVLISAPYPHGCTPPPVALYCQNFLDLKRCWRCWSTTTARVPPRNDQLPTFTTPKYC